MNLKAELSESEERELGDFLDRVRGLLDSHISSDPISELD